MKTAPLRWLIEDLVTTILDSSPEELVDVYAKLEALSESIKIRLEENQDENTN
jgi:hypothetical protein